MAFIDIASSKNWDKIVNEYVKGLKQFKEEQLESKTLGLANVRENERTFQPIVKATQESTQAILASINPTLKAVDKI